MISYITEEKISTSAAYSANSCIYVAQVRYPCKYRKNGCQESFLIDQLDAHHHDCAYKAHKCPFKFSLACPWSGSVDDIKQHLNSVHIMTRETFSTDRTYYAKLTDLGSNNLYCQVVFTMGEVRIRHVYIMTGEDKPCSHWDR